MVDIAPGLFHRQRPQGLADTDYPAQRFQLRVTEFLVNAVLPAEDEEQIDLTVHIVVEQVL